MNELQSFSKWWTRKDDEVARSVFGYLNYVENKQMFRHTANLRHARLYGNFEMLGFGANEYAKRNMFQNGGMSLNVIHACIDTAAAKIAKAKPKPLFLSTKGNWSVQTRCKNLTRYVEALFSQAHVYQEAVKVFFDAGIFGTGALKVIVDDETQAISVERVLIDEIIVEDSDGVYGCPRHLIQRRFASRDSLIAQFPKSKMGILDARAGRAIDSQVNQINPDLVLVVEAWHLPSGPKSKDGKYSISVDNCTLYLEDYDKDYFPFEFFRWSDAILGFFGNGIAEQLTPIQKEINYLLMDIQEANHLMARPRIFLEEGSKIVPSHLDSDHGIPIIPFIGQPPVFMTPSPMAGAVFEHLNFLYAKAFETTGISQMAAASKKQPGLDSGVALREFSDIESERFNLVGQRWEIFFMELAKKFIDISRDLYKSGGAKLKIKGKTKRFIKDLKFADVNLKDEQFEMDVESVGFLPNTAAGKLQKVQELVQSGFIRKEYGLSLLEFPDTEQVMTLENAAFDDVMMLIERMLEDGEYDPPEQYMNLDLSMTLVQSSYLRAKQAGAPEDRLKLLRDFMKDLEVLQAPPPPPEAPEAPPGAAGAIAQPMAPPQSDLMPIVPK